MIAGSVARRYAKALLSIGIDNKNYESFARELDQFKKLLEHTQLREVLENPTYPQFKRTAIVKSLVDRLNPSKIVRNFLLLLTERNRIKILPEIAVQYMAMVDEQAGRTRAQVTTAKQLDPLSMKHIQEALEKKTKKQVQIEQRTDINLIAGIVAKVGSVIYDGSVRTRLNQMHESLLEGKQ